MTPDYARGWRDRGAAIQRALDATAEPIPPAVDTLGSATLPPVGEGPILRMVIRPVLTEMQARDGIARTVAAERMLLAICGQEADWRHRDQVVTGKAPGAIGPATGLWQFERLGGVLGVLRHDRTKAIAAAWCGREGVLPTADAVWRALVTNDRLACVFARLLLWTDPRPMPLTEQDGFDAYIRNWRPGAWTRGSADQKAKLRAKWGGHWRRADEAVKE